MADKGVVMNAPMVQALLEGKKTQHRQVLTLRGYPSFSCFNASNTPGYDWQFRRADKVWCDFRADDLPLPLRAGDRLYVREAIRCFADVGDDAEVTYQVDGSRWQTGPRTGEISASQLPAYFRTIDRCANAQRSCVVRANHMPRWASRLTLTITKVKIQRLCDISGREAVAEGIFWPDPGDRMFDPGLEADERRARARFADFWDATHPRPAKQWNDNPWVLAMEFVIYRGNVDLNLCR